METDTNSPQTQSPHPRLLRTLPDLRELMSALRAQGNRVGLVPTMGALHAGHLSLAKKSCRNCDATVVTIFVNPTQFAPNEDLDKYPRTLTRDLELLGELGVPYVFAPTEATIYPDGFSTFVQPPDVAGSLEGSSRPDHFRGVATIVLKLFQLIPADIAYFGQKDYQQCLVIRRMVEDLAVPIEIDVCPIVREPDGLAMSSRNRYLTAEERQQATAISRALQQASALADQGESQAEVLREAMRLDLAQAGISRIEYVEVADADTLRPLERIEGPAVALIAAFVGKTRLIDNWLLQ